METKEFDITKTVEWKRTARMMAKLRREREAREAAQAANAAWPTHSEHAATTKLTTPCAAWHVNFGGGCLNCGWTPRPSK